MRLPAILFALLAATNAQSAELSGMAADIFGAVGGPGVKVDDYLFNPLDLGDWSVMPGMHPLAEVEERVGMDAHGANGLRWLCTEAGGMRTWFIAEPAAEGEEASVTAVIYEAVKDAGVMGCVAAEADRAPDAGNDLPGIGATLADLAARYGSAEPDAAGRIAYRSEETLGDEGFAWVEVKTVHYRLRDGKVDGVAYVQRSAAAPTGFAKLAEMSPALIAERLDITTFRNSTGPRREPGLTELWDFGFRDVYRAEDGGVEVFNEDRSWMFGLKVMETADAPLILCITDHALNGGTYDAVSAIAVEEMPDGSIVAIGEDATHPDCAERP